MVFSSLEFVSLFLVSFFLLYYIVPNRMAKNTIIFLFSLFFYAWGEPIYVFLMLGSIIINYVLALKMQKYKEVEEKKNNSYRYAEIKHARKMVKVMLLSSIIVDLGLLVVFKYTDFLVDNMNNWFGFKIPNPEISLPIGISFFTFQILSYVVDVYNGKCKVQTNLINLGAYISCFPQLIAGPIVRYSDIEDDLTNRKETLELTSEGMRDFIVGFSKKALIANTCGEIIKVLGEYSNVQYKMIGAIIIALCYTLQIYFDFSGYSDMAIGLGKMMGFRYCKNFDYPYIASSITDFWRRWHISLSSFFRDYVYIPLGGNRVKVWRHILNLLIVWFLTGLWHGASWNFVLWGLYYGVLLIIEKYTPEKIKKHVPKFIAHLLTIILVVFGWIIFRIETMDEFCEFMKTLFGYYGAGHLEFLKHIGIVAPHYIIAFILAIIGSTPLVKKIYDKLKDNKVWFITFDVLLIFILILSICFVAVGTYNPFIYFKF
ncbi:MAG: MBOAT family protein [Clostridia bacterium]|nr:MBOAT family protein [Clostridia bacterium]